MKRLSIIFLLFFLCCTNPFATRNPDKPAQNTNPQPVNSLQNYPDSVIWKMQYAFSEKNSNYYMDCLADPSFKYVPQQNESYRLTGWTRDDEYNYFNSLINNNDVVNLKLIIDKDKIQPATPIGSSQDTMQTRFEYEIEINFKLRKEYFRGQSILKLFRSQQSLWYIYYWEDLQITSDDADSTWSTLKANYR